MEETSYLIALWAYAWGASGLFSAVVASAKGRSVGGWLLLGIIFGVIGLIAISGLPDHRAQRKQGGTAAAGENDVASKEGLTAVITVAYLVVIVGLWFYFSR